MLINFSAKPLYFDAFLKLPEWIVLMKTMKTGQSHQRLGPLRQAGLDLLRLVVNACGTRYGCEIIWWPTYLIPIYCDAALDDLLNIYHQITYFEKQVVAPSPRLHAPAVASPFRLQVWGFVSIDWQSVSLFLIAICIPLTFVCMVRFVSLSSSSFFSPSVWDVLRSIPFVSLW